MYRVYGFKKEIVALIEEARALQDEIVRLRRLFHSQPELSFEEYESKKILSEYLSKLGFQVREGFLETSLIAELGKAPFIALRSDMDALPIQEQNVSAYVSRNPGIMHACGHDAHMACILAAAKLIACESQKQALAKGIRIIFEPGSESDLRSGAQELIEKGVLAEVEGILGFHVDSTLAASDISVVKDAGLTGCKIIVSTGFSIEEEATARRADDPRDAAILRLANLICRLKEAIPGFSGRSQVKNLSFSDLKTNSLSGELELELALNASSKEELAEELSILEKIAGDTGRFLICKLENSEANGLVSGDFLFSVAEELCTKERIKVTGRRAWSKDFEIYGEQVPAAFFYLGTSCGPRSHHSPSFEIDERVLYLASAVLAKAAISAASLRV